MEHISKAQIKMVRGLKLKKNRDEAGLFVAEGHKCIEELERYFELVLKVFKIEDLRVKSEEGKCVWASDTEIEQMSGMKTPQGEIGVFKKHSIGDLRFLASEKHDLKVWKNDDLVLVLDGVQDPGNLGTIIRTCDWFGVKHIVCSPDTADCYNPKVVQATMGSLGRVEVHYTNLVDWIEDLRFLASEKHDLKVWKNEDLRIIGTVLDGDELRVKSEELRVKSGETCLVVMGSEGNGISPKVRALLTDAVRIPTYPANKKASDVVESLNVSIATGIILSHLRQV
jgi:TrmH family RNA methyltransferase